MNHIVTFQASGRGKAQCPADPDYPTGKEIDIAGNLPSCVISLPYPAPECGHFLIKCVTCKVSIAVTAAGRPDDPTKITVPCNLDFAVRA